MSSRIDQIKQRLAAATPSHYRDYQWPFVLIERNPDWEFIAHAPQDLRDLLTFYDTVKAWRKEQNPMDDFPFDAILSTLDSPVGDEGAE